MDPNKDLAVATVRGDLKELEKILGAGADVDARQELFNMDYTALMWAAIRGREDALRLLLEHGANPRALGSEGEISAAVVAACAGELGCLGFLARAMDMTPQEGAKVAAIAEQAGAFEAAAWARSWSEAIDLREEAKGKGAPKRHSSL